ncbi:helicase protein [Oesophagostomum dentatum]|uniref:RNA helicase n=1 Tax=Oesophagostomum dentatum TaxID=61180 RepID=A0A0B1SPC3_OESDE|nr:helicase protein [Oesophagostomum dentatum]
METINENIVTVICGETGSGKTTQIPQFLYEAGYANDGQLIGITEPRRVAAISMAQRVGEELGAPTEVSYQIRYEGNRTDKTRILFMTDGVLMKEMESDIMLKKYSAILIDEAHERSMYSDVLIGMLSRIAPLRAKTSNPLKLIIMSATLRLDDFTHKRLFPVIEPKVINVEARQFPVTVHFEKRTPDDYMIAAFRKVCRIHEALPDGAVLVFVSGQQEVRQLLKKLVARYPIQYEKSKDGELLVRGGKKWKKKRLEEVQNLKLEDFKEDRNQRFDGEDLLETGVGDTMWDDYEDGEQEENDRLDTPMSLPPKDCPPLYCLPLYSLLSSEKQRRVFEPPPEGARMCVIATNVAETSLTIPGVKYVVDSGYEKRRLYDPITGVSQFVVTHVSQASADQRAGRAGRIAPGHAYRLYSSAVFQNFEKFSRPEILDKPADQLVLHLKSMNIVKVVNFPFPSAPDPETLEAAESRLIKLGALATTTKDGRTEARITPLGRSLSVFPLAPAYAKVIAMANQHSLMPYAILLISALSVREPLVPVSSIRGETDEETKEKMTEVLKLRRGWCGKGPGRRLGDLLVLMHAVNCSETEKMNAAACARLGLRHKAMKEIHRLRIQLTNIVNTSFKQAADVTFDPNLPSPSDAQAQMLRQMMVAGLADRIAKRVDRSAGDEEVPKGAYQTMKLQVREGERDLD